VSKMSFVSKFLLDDFGYHLRQIFGDWPYQVGTSVLTSTWDDVDVRVILDDEEYQRAGYGDPENPERNPKWVSTCLALSQFGRVLTGLPIDCQIQQQTYANEHFSQKDGCVRSALGINRKLREQVTQEATR
jgi:hypothetical protein